MNPLLPLVLGSLKALLLVLVAAGFALALRGRPARLRAVVWGTALAGCLVIPLVTPLLPSWSLPVPASIARFVTPNETVTPSVVRMAEPRMNTELTAIRAPETAAVEPIVPTRNRIFVGEPCSIVPAIDGSVDRRNRKHAAETH